MEDLLLVFLTFFDILEEWLNGNGAIGGEIIVCAGAFGSIILLKYLLLRSERLQTPPPPDSTGEIIFKRDRNTENDVEEEECGNGDLARRRVEEYSPGRFELSEKSSVAELIRGEPRVTGLQNLGNTCYVNGLLQALACVSEFYDWMAHSSKLVCLPSSRPHPLPSVSETPFLSRPPPKPHAQRMSLFFHSLWKVMNVINSRDKDYQNGHSFAATALVKVMFGGSGGRFQHYQQDPDELFLFMMNMLTAATAGPYEFLNETLDHFANCGLISAAGPHSVPLDRPNAGKPWLSMPLQGLFHQDLYCVVCKTYRPQPLEMFHSLSLTLPDRGRGKNQYHELEHLLEKYFTPADLDAVDCPTCASRTRHIGDGLKSVRTPHLKRISIAKGPKILCLHIRRAVWDGGDGWKRSDKVSFPSTLSIQKYSFLRHIGGNHSLPNQKSPLSQSLYSLKSVLVHMGASSSGGHIVTYRKGPVHSSMAEAWYFTSDQLVRPASWTEVESSNPYMLFYELIKPSSA
ncbi:putative Ubiquitin carboxyl-terminal hydrolase 30-like protein [Hypsibius exemplaris]|uniref:ubiquitinyl hydrolase 1 n=1 Tax=Hypsibius exemplaris TaxID=2072580 RepID=A0A1W0WVC9_HYPEX|nr:putative Ubiquitin carboxyl-terminal hydrolase 30-like protein [Hypsibius exemplaris]